MNIGIVVKICCATVEKNVPPNILITISQSPLKNQMPRIPAPAIEKAMGIPKRKATTKITMGSKVTILLISLNVSLRMEKNLFSSGGRFFPRPPKVNDHDKGCEK